jgi:hypothetical protein
MSRSIRILVPVIVVGCSSSDPGGLGSTEQNLYRSGAFEPSTTTVGPTDTGVDTGTKSDSGIIIKSPGTVAVAESSAPCAPVRVDVTTFGRKCWDLAKTTPTGTWNVAPIFSSAPTEIRDTHCALTWLAKSPTCAPPDLSALALNCQERHSATERSAACAADPGQCSTSGSATAVAPENIKTAKSSTPCDPIVIDGGIPGGYVGGCDSCGIINGGILYLTNPYSSGTILTNVTTVSGNGQLTVSMPANSSAAISVGPSYIDGPVYVWP